jgi:hypothetical protein
MQHPVSIIGLSFEFASAGLDTNRKISNLLDYRNSVHNNLIEEQSRPKPCSILISMYIKEISASESILQSLVR